MLHGRDSRRITSRYCGRRRAGQRNHGIDQQRWLWRRRQCCEPRRVLEPRRRRWSQRSAKAGLPRRRHVRRPCDCWWGWGRRGHLRKWKDAHRPRRRRRWRAARPAFARLDCGQVRRRRGQPNRWRHSHSRAARHALELRRRWQQVPRRLRHWIYQWKQRRRRSWWRWGLLRRRPWRCNHFRHRRLRGRRQRLHRRLLANHPSGLFSRPGWLGNIASGSSQRHRLVLLGRGGPGRRASNFWRERAGGGCYCNVRFPSLCCSLSIANGGHEAADEIARVGDALQLHGRSASVFHTRGRRLHQCQHVRRNGRQRCNSWVSRKRRNWGIWRVCFGLSVSSPRAATLHLRWRGWLRRP